LFRKLLSAASSAALIVASLYSAALPAQANQAPDMSAQAVDFGGSASFAGGSLNAGQSADWNIGTGDFTVEWFQFQTATSSAPRVFSLGNYPSAALGFSIENSTAYVWLASGQRITHSLGSTSDYLNTWVHFAITRSAGLLNLYVDGVRVASVSSTEEITTTGLNLRVGIEEASNTAFPGLLTNFHFVNGTALYTAETLTIPTAPITAAANTKLLLSFASEEGLLVDSSAAARSIVASGAVTFSLGNPFAVVVPDAPTLKSAVWTASGAEFAWTPGYDGGSPVTDYEYELDGSGSWLSTESTATKHQVSVPTDTQLSIRVRAVSEFGRSAPSNSRSVTSAPSLQVTDLQAGWSLFPTIKTHPISGETIVLWASYSSGQIEASIIDPSGSIGTPFVIAEGGGENEYDWGPVPLIPGPSGEWLVSWNAFTIVTGNLFVNRVLSQALKVVDGEITKTTADPVRVDEPDSMDNHYIVASAWNSTSQQYMVAFPYSKGGTRYLGVRLLDATGELVEGLKDPSDQDIVGQFVVASGSDVQHQHNLGVAASANGWVVTWTSGATNSTRRAVARTLTLTDGKFTLGSILDVSSSAPRVQVMHPSIEAITGGHVVVSRHYDPGDDDNPEAYGIRARWLNSDGTLGDEVTVVEQDGAVSLPQFASSGVDLMVTWNSPHDYGDAGERVMSARLGLDKSVQTPVEVAESDFSQLRPSVTYWAAINSYVFAWNQLDEDDNFDVWITNFVGEPATEGPDPEEPSVTAAPFTGPILNTTGLGSVRAGSNLVISGSNLNGVRKVEVGGLDAQVVVRSDGSIEITVPRGLSAGVYDIVITSDAGRVTVQRALTVLGGFAAGEARPSTKMVSENRLKVWVFEAYGAGKVQIMLNGQEVAWANALSADDPKLRDGYLVRTLALAAGKNVLEVFVDGERVSRRVATVR
jgi:hypothetical protein